jgi:hypothetical protein
MIMTIILLIQGFDLDAKRGCPEAILDLQTDLSYIFLSFPLATTDSCPMILFNKSGQTDSFNEGYNTILESFENVLLSSPKL